ncbi:MAG: hypothetical protein WDA02_03100 [Saccharofermentanales bacterium]
MEFYNNDKNDKLKFKINIEGIDINNIEPRLIITNENKNYLFYGKVNDSICTFDLPELSNYNKGDTGKIKFEIVSEDLYFPVWSDDFEIKTRASVKIEELYQEIQQPSKPKVAVNAILEKEKPVVEKEKPSFKNNDIDAILEREKQKELELVKRMKELENINEHQINDNDNDKKVKSDTKKDMYKNTKQYKPIETISEQNKKHIRRFSDI